MLSPAYATVAPIVLDNCETLARTQILQLQKKKANTPGALPICGSRRSSLFQEVGPRGVAALRIQEVSSYLVDPASSHMLVLKIKPCMSKYKHLYRETANGSLKQLWFI